MQNHLVLFKSAKTSDYLPLTIDRRGQSLIEVIVALGVVIILALSLVSTSLITQRASRAAKNQAQATKLVQQNIEQMRVFRDRLGFEQIPTSAVDCYILQTVNIDPANWTLATTSCTTGGENITLNKVTFTRKIAITSISPIKKSITVSVSWNDSGNTLSVETQTYLTAWCQGPIVGSSPCPSP